MNNLTIILGICYNVCYFSYTVLKLIFQHLLYMNEVKAHKFVHQKNIVNMHAFSPKSYSTMY